MCEATKVSIVGFVSTHNVTDMIADVLKLVTQTHSKEHRLHHTKVTIKHSHCEWNKLLCVFVMATTQ